MSSELCFQAWATDFVLGGVSGCISKTITAPIERVQVLIQTQDANPLIRKGEVARYTSIPNCFQRIRSEQGLSTFWRGNYTNCIRYFPMQAFNLSFKDSIKKMFPRKNPKSELVAFFAVNMLSGGLAAAGSLCIVYPLDLAKTRLVADVGGGKKTFDGLWDCLAKTSRGPNGVFSLYTGFGVALVGTTLYRGFQLGTFDTLVGLNPFVHDEGIVGLVPTFVSAQTTILATASITYPFGTVSRRLQMQAERPVEQHVYKGGMDCLKKIAVEEGISSGIYKGFVANAFRSVGAALMLVLYDRAHELFGLEH